MRRSTTARRKHALPAILVSALCVLPAAALVAPTPSPEAAQAIVKRYCVNCHNDDLKPGGVSLIGLQATEVGGAANVWERVFRKVRTGEMPPVGMPRPDAPEISSFTAWLETELDRSAAARPNPGAPSIHRLNRVEYSNAVRDLVALDLDHSSGLPADDSGYGFDNIGDVLAVSPLHLEKYMTTARRVSRLAVGTVKLSPAVEKFTAARVSPEETSNELPPSVQSGIAFRRHFPVDAEYSILVRLRGNPDANLPPPKLDVRLDGQRVKLFDASINLAEEAQYTRSYELRLSLKAGMHVLGAGLLSESTKSTSANARQGADPPSVTSAAVDYVLVGGPFNPTGPGETESRKRIFVCRPASGEPEAPCAKKILSSLTRRAYRRPVDKADIEPLLKLFASGRKDGGSFDAGIETALRAILVSPSFLFRVERSARGSTPGSVHSITDLELASRLSFFLWSSIPDEELLGLAERGKLRAALHQQVSRMLADPKSKALVDNFAGQWLHLRNIAGWRPDPEKYKDFDESLRSALQRETELFFQHIVRDDRSVLEFLDADYSMLNERLARHYGIPGVRGSYYRRVAFDGKERGGILTHGSILTVTSYPTRTSPVLRGKWILDNVLGAPPPPPPPDVPTLAENASGSAQNLRAALEKHRASAACASCHARLDPLGFALENYDAIGRFRTSEGGTDIDASGSLPGGTTVHGAGDLKKVLMDRRDEFVECLAHKLLTYALGRGLEHYDLPAVRQIRREAAANGYRFSSLALAIVNSVPFQMRRTLEP